MIYFIFALEHWILLKELLDNLKLRSYRINLMLRAWKIQGRKKFFSAILNEVNIKMFMYCYLVLLF